MKCPKCGEEMFATMWGDFDTARGNYIKAKYVCPKCNCEVNENSYDIPNYVYREPLFQPNDKVTNYGWICPKCGAVLSPSTNECPYCTPHKLTCGPSNESTIKTVPLSNDITSQAQVYSPQHLMENITVTGSCDSTSKPQVYKGVNNETNNT